MTEVKKRVKVIAIGFFLGNLAIGLVAQENIITEKIKIGDPLPAIVKKAKSELIQVSSVQFDEAFECQIDDVHYDLGIDANGRISYISTQNKYVKTPEAISVGSKLNDIMEALDAKLIKIPGWAFYVKLPSGWCAAFTIGKFATEGKLNQKSKVKWLFKSKYLTD
jgi:hypothetical protein